jgi:hypothetical protein
MNFPTRLALACAAVCLAVHAQARAACSVEQTASNEIVIRTSVGNCDYGALREGLQGAISASTAAAAAASAAAAGSLAGVRRSGGQAALWRMAVMNSQIPATTLNMPGRAP